MRTTLKLMTLSLFAAVLVAAAGFMWGVPTQAQMDESCYEEILVQATVVNPFTGQSSETKVKKEIYDTDCNNIQDGRINQTDRAAEAAIYCTRYGVEVYDLDLSGDGDFAFRATWNEIERIPAKPNENTLIDGVPGFALYRLTSGEMQLNGPANWEGKPYVFIWDGCSRPSAS